MNLLFVRSFYLGIQILEGALTSSHFLGFHPTDVTGGLEVMLAYKIPTIDLVIGMGTLLFVWWLLGGRMGLFSAQSGEVALRKPEVHATYAQKSGRFKNPLSGPLWGNFENQRHDTDQLLMDCTSIPRHPNPV